MDMEDLKIRAKSAPWYNGVEFLARYKKAVATGLILDYSTNPAMISEPTFILSFQEAQVLMDDLWNSGLRPTEGAGSAGSLKATERHLEDMRKLVFKEKI